MGNNPLEVLVLILTLPFRIMGEILNSLGGGSSRRSLSSNRSLVPRSYISSSSVIERDYRQPIQSPQAEVAGATYDNEEKTSITWSKEGFPVEIVTHRHAVRSNDQ